MLPIRQDRTENMNHYSMILTEQEKETVVEYAISSAKKAFIQRKQAAGLPEARIMLILAQKDFLKELGGIDKIIADANERKHWFQEHEENRKSRLERERLEKDELSKVWSPHMFHKLIKHYFRTDLIKEFAYDESNTLLLKAVCFFMSKDERFETELEYSFKKGLLLLGPAGVGKTEIIKAVSDNPVKPINVYSLLDITEHIRSNGEFKIDYSKTIALDDVGSEEPTVKHYGTDISWFKDFIESYYLKHNDFSRLIITTNCDGAELERLYGLRVRDRMREMFNVVQIKGESRRK